MGTNSVESTQSGAQLARVAPLRTGRPGANRRAALSATAEGEDVLAKGNTTLARLVASANLPSLVVLRMTKGMSQAELARESGIAQPQLSRLERGRNQNPDLGTLRKISMALNIDVVEVVRAVEATSIGSD